VGRASALLSRRAALAVALGACLGLYYAYSPSLWSASRWWDVAFLGLALTPAVFVLVYLVLPLHAARGLLPLAAALAALAWALREADVEAASDFAKLAAASAAGFWFCSLFDTARAVAGVAFVIPWVDAYSVWAGPTRTIVSERPEVFSAVAFALPVPGERGAAQLGPPDLLFFALFLAAAARFRLRPELTWLLMALSFGATLAVAQALEVSGLPALPGLSLAFLAANGDRLWADLAAARRSRRSAPLGRGRGRER
jgi:hypothetical protein